MRNASIGHGMFLIESTGVDARAYIGLYFCCCCLVRQVPWFADRM
jgi:hypothetical protein